MAQNYGPLRFYEYLSHIGVAYLGVINNSERRPDSKDPEFEAISSLFMYLWTSSIASMACAVVFLNVVFRPTIGNLHLMRVMMIIIFFLDVLNVFTFTLPRLMKTGFTLDAPWGDVVGNLFILHLLSIIRSDFPPQQTESTD